MKIGLITANYPPAIHEGGISHYSSLLASQLRKIGQPCVIATGDDYRGAEPHVSVFKGAWGPSAVRSIMEVFRNEQVDVVNVQYSPAMYPQPFKAALPVLLKAFPTVVSFHTLWGGPRVNYLNALRLLHGARAVAATNSEVLHLVRKYLPWHLKKTFFVPIWANILADPPAETRREIIGRYRLEEGKTLLFFGMLYPGKGFDTLLRALHEVIHARGRDCRLVIAGGGISDTEECRRKAGEAVALLGLEEKVVITGRLSEERVAALFEECAAVVLPFDSGASDRRGTLMAALAYGKAIVTTPPRVSIPWFRQRENMLWAGASSARSLAEAIHSVLSDSALRARLEAGARAVAMRFSWERIARDTSRVLHEAAHA